MVSVGALCQDAIVPQNDRIDVVVLPERKQTCSAARFQADGLVGASYRLG